MTPEVGLNIAALARRTGVPAHTLRKWEQRYRVLAPSRTSGGQRRYGEHDVARVRWLRDRLAEGYRISEAASLLALPDAPPRTAAELRVALLDAVERTSAEETEALLDHVFALFPLETALEEVVCPSLVDVGDRWQAGTLSVVQEHLLSAAVRGRVVRLLADRRPAVRGRAVLLCPGEERHELGLLMLGSVLAAEGWGVVYLGAETPFGEALSLAEMLQADAVCVSVTMPEHVDELGAREAPTRKGPPVFLGGSGASRELAGRLGARHVPGPARRALSALGRVAR